MTETVDDVTATRDKESVLPAPCDRTARLSTVDPVIVAKHQRRLNGVDEIVLSLTPKG